MFKYKNLNFQINDSLGFIALPIIIALAALILIASASVITLSFNETDISSDVAKSQQALVYAESGAREAFEQIVRNNSSCTDVGCYTTTADVDCGTILSNVDCFTIDFTSNSTGCSTTNNGCARVKVASATTPKIVTSVGTVGNVTRAIQATVTLDVNGAITGITWNLNF